MTQKLKSGRMGEDPQEFQWEALLRTNALDATMSCTRTGAHFDAR